MSLFYWNKSDDHPQGKVSAALIAIKVDDGSDDAPRWEIKLGLFEWSPAKNKWRYAITKEPLTETEFMWLPASVLLRSVDLPQSLPTVPADPAHEAWFLSEAANQPFLHNITRRQSRFIWRAAREQLMSIGPERA